MIIGMVLFAATSHITALFQNKENHPYYHPFQEFAVTLEFVWISSMM